MSRPVFGWDGNSLNVAWRVGRKVGRTIYTQAGAEPSDDDRLIGMMDTPELAAAAVLAHNQYGLNRHLEGGGS